MDQKFKHGDRVTCEIEGNYIGDAVIVINNSGIYICSNDPASDGGHRGFDMLGYMYAWGIRSDFTYHSVTNLRLSPLSLEEELEITEEYFDKIMDDGIKSGEEDELKITEDAITTAVDPVQFVSDYIARFERERFTREFNN